jgi:hypothetical protein
MINLLPLIIFLLVLPAFSAGLIIFLMRSKEKIKAARGCFYTGIAGAFITAITVFLSSTVPIAPYETGQGAWLPILWQTLLALYVGFGLGTAVAGLVLLFVIFIRAARSHLKK